MKLAATLTGALCGALMFASVAAAQDPGPAGDKVGVAIALQAGGESYKFNGQATCGHEPKGYIYALPAGLWNVEYDEGPRSMSLTFWRPTSGSGDMFMLSVSSAGKSYRTSTVKVGDEGTVRGSGKVTFAPAGKGGTFTVNATAANGAKFSGTIKCDAFRAIVAEGGN